MDKLIFTVLVILGLSLVSFLSKRAIKKVSHAQAVKMSRTHKLIKAVNLLTLFVGAFLLIGIWGVSPYDIWVVFSAALGFLGVALFAGWSILSNLSAAFLIYLNDSITQGDSIKVVDGDNSISGIVHEVSLFFIRLIREDGSMAQIPNSFIFQKVLLRKKPN